MRGKTAKYMGKCLLKIQGGTGDWQVARLCWLLPIHGRRIRWRKRIGEMREIKFGTWRYRRGE